MCFADGAAERISRVPGKRLRAVCICFLKLFFAVVVLVNKKLNLETVFLLSFENYFVGVCCSFSLFVGTSFMADVAAPADREHHEDRRGTHRKLSCQESIQLACNEASLQCSVSGFVLSK